MLGAVCMYYHTLPTNFKGFICNGNNIKVKVRNMEKHENRPEQLEKQNSAPLRNMAADESPKKVRRNCHQRNATVG